MIPGHEAAEGYWVGQRSECCTSRIVYYESAVAKYITIPLVLTAIPKHIEFRCCVCDRVVSRDVAK